MKDEALKIVKLLREMSTNREDQFVILKMAKEHIGGKNIHEREKIVQKIKTLEISDHAIVRFLEQTKRINTKAVKSEILTDSLRATHKAFGNGTYPIMTGLKAVIRNNKIVTIK